MTTTRGQQAANDDDCSRDLSPEAGRHPRRQVDGSRPAAVSGPAEVPTPRIARKPIDQLDYDDRHETRATSDDRVLKRYITLRWHQTAQRLVASLGPVALGFAIYFFSRWADVSLAEAAKIGLFGLVSGAAGLGLPAAGRAIRRRVGRRKKDQRDDASAS